MSMSRQRVKDRAWIGWLLIGLVVLVILIPWGRLGERFDRDLPPVPAAPSNSQPATPGTIE